jgi:hypothetical protein
MFESCILTSLLMEVSPMKVHSLGSSRGMLPLTAAYSQLHSSTGMIVVHERENNVNLWGVGCGSHTGPLCPTHS